MRALAEVPLLVVLVGLGALAMFVPAAHGFVVGQDRIGRAFLYSGTIFLTLAVMVGIAMSGRTGRDAVRNDLLSLVLAYLLLPVVMAVPFIDAVRDTTFLRAWFEMVSSFTTTGASLYDTPGRIAETLHLWRAVVGWLGGLFVLVSAAAILAPLNLGGFEVMAPGAAGRRGDGGRRTGALALAVFPAYAGATLALWVGLLIAGDRGLTALVHAMSTLSTSGISPVQGMTGASSGFLGEALIFLGLMVAVTRRSLPGAVRADRSRPIWADPEVRLAVIFVTTIPLLLFLRHWVGAIESELPDDVSRAASALWGAVFTVLSFLTTTGFTSSGWEAARTWSGLAAPGMLLLGVAMMGGGVATTAGGVRLLRVYALYRHGRHELERLAMPSSVGGGGGGTRAMRTGGASLAFVTFMLFALSLGVLNLALALAGVGFERGVTLSVAALTTTGPLAGAIAAGGGWQGLGDAATAILAVGMVLGRLETLALVALLAPGTWRR